MRILPWAYASCETFSFQGQGEDFPSFFFPPDGQRLWPAPPRILTAYLEPFFFFPFLLQRSGTNSSLDLASDDFMISISLFASIVPNRPFTTSLLCSSFLQVIPFFPFLSIARDRQSIDPFWIGNGKYIAYFLFFLLYSEDRTD